MKLRSDSLATDFNNMEFPEKQAVVCALIRGAAGQWGNECYAAADAGDNRLYNLEQICDWIDSLTP